MAKAKRTLRALKRLIFSASAAMIVVLTFLLWPKFVQWGSPKFKGKTAEEWLPAFSHKIDYEVVNAFGTDAAQRVAQVLVQKETFHQKLWRSLPFAAQSAFKAFRPPDYTSSRRGASFWLHALGPDARSALPILTNYVAKEGLFVHTLAYIAPEDPFVLEIAGNLLTSPAGSSRVSASSSLSILGNRGAALIPILTNVLANPTSELPYNVLLGLASIGPSAEAAVPFIRPYLANTNTRGNALTAIQGIGSSAADAVPELCSVLTNTQGQTQIQAAYCLLLIGPASNEALPHLKRLQTGETNLLQLLVWCATGLLEDDVGPPIEKLRHVITSPKHSLPDDFVSVHYPSDLVALGNAYARGARSMALVIASMEPFQSRRLLPAIESLLHHENPEINALARQAHWRITKDSVKCAPLLLQVLNGGEDYQVHTALECLNEMELSSAHLPGLLDFLNNHRNRWKDRKQALQLIGQIDPKVAGELRMSKF